MMNVTFNTYDYSQKKEIKDWLIGRCKSGSKIGRRLDPSLYPLKSIPPGWHWKVFFNNEEDKIFFLLKFGDKIDDWTEEKELEEGEESDGLEEEWDY